VEIRQGWKTDVFNKLEASELKKKSKKPEYKGKVDEKVCFSIIYGPRRDTWDLVAPTADAAERWVSESSPSHFSSFLCVPSPYYAITYAVSPFSRLFSTHFT
jgi:hypothetical protein